MNDIQIRGGMPVGQGSEVDDDSLLGGLAAVLAPQIEIVRPIGRGGMGAVYLGREPAIEREVAVKVLPLELAKRDEFRERFRREGRIAAKLSHPHIVPLYTFGETAETLYYVMGFVRGESLADRLDRVNTIEPGETLRILTQLADALGYAHEQGIIHRDIKPENVLLDDRTGLAILTDFGVARIVEGAEKLTQTGGVVGTPHYMSPEQATGGETDARSDLYSLGVLAYRMLTGKLPIESDSFGALVAKHARNEEETIPQLDATVPTNLTNVVMKCLRKRPSDRFRTADEIGEILGKDPTEIFLPEEIKDTAGRGFWLLPTAFVALLLAPFELFLWEHVDMGWRMAVIGVQLIPLVGLVFVAGAALQARAAGLPRSEIARFLMQSPDWYWGWVPPWFRRSGDVWARLPSHLRHMRIVSSLIAPLLLAMVISLPLAVTATEDAEFEKYFNQMFPVESMVMLLCLLALAVTHMRADHHLKALGYDSKERLRIVSLSSSRHRTWREKRLSDLLESSDRIGGTPPAQEARTPEGQVDAVCALTQELPASLGAEAAAAARSLLDSIQALEKEGAKFGAILDRDELARLEGRLKALDEGGSGGDFSSMRDVLVRQRDLLLDLEKKLDAIEQEAEARREELSLLWKEVAAAAVSGNGKEAASLEAYLRALGVGLTTAATTIRVTEDEPTLMK